MRLLTSLILLVTTLASCQSPPVCEYEVCADNLKEPPPSWVVYSSLIDQGLAASKEGIKITHFYLTSEYSGRWDYNWHCAAGTAESKPGTTGTQTYRLMANGILPAAVRIKC
ncbi:hypothetical protein CKM354_001298100 [Cercospora kikuchii]|uniref:Lipoprotein n=1 Tax=Cercospora kikuchii TaxID=84275 RepID=A0A9P3FN81_9PEZI|nr:uncharacterized protein CKM354_001298100 [Cercospora kikuchii]GIZ49965.1 hypothetical protein CKM354_001298100 [Cercospora kikuchii]